MTIDPPMWSVGMEFQIYLFLPILLIPAYKRFGLAGMMIAGIGLGLVPHFTLPAHWNLDWTYPQLLGAFTIGAAGAIIAVSHGRRSEARFPRLCWLVAGLLYVVALSLPPDDHHATSWLVDLVFSLACGALLVALSHVSLSQITGLPQAAVRFLESRPLMFLGRISYSLYLIHWPAWRVLRILMAKVAHTPVSFLVFRLFIGVPIAVFVSWLFYLACERHFVNAKHPKPVTSRDTTPG
jgi:peptidoglycan/LPS O-acetylase OafA/YrhL